MATVLETCGISPSPEAAAELSVPLSFFDLIYVKFHPTRRLFFYEYPCSTAQFLDTVVPKLKQSLSRTLKYYLPVAGNLLYPLDSHNRKPFFRYVAGDSVSLIIAESNNDFDVLVGNHARDADQFYDFVPQMPAVGEESEYKIIPLTALQLTLFPGRGFCIGLAITHALGDGRSTASFILAWASINKHGGDAEFLKIKGESLPNFDRSVIQDTQGIDSIFWKVLGQIPLKESWLFPLPTNRVRATFILRQNDINNLKDLVLAKAPSLNQVSSFVVTTSYVWTCWVKSGDAAGEEVEDTGSKVFFFPADGRGRLNYLINPPVPVNYFGNCVTFGSANIEHKKLVGDDGFVIAAEAIAEEIRNKVNNKDELFKGVEKWMLEMVQKEGVRAMGVSGSPKFDLVDADFGWGKPRKMEIVSIDEDEYTMSLCKSRGFGGLEVELSLPKERMGAFAAIFTDGLRPIHDSFSSSSKFVCSNMVELDQLLSP